MGVEIKKKCLQTDSLFF